MYLVSGGHGRSGIVDGVVWHGGAGGRWRCASLTCLSRCVDERRESFMLEQMLMKGERDKNDGVQEQATSVVHVAPIFSALEGAHAFKFQI
jgi:hypothetical protein